METSTRQTVKAFLVAPLLVPFIFYLPALIAFHHIDGLNWFASYFVFGIYAVPLTWIGELFLGLPAWMIFKQYNIRAFPAYVTGGAFLGLVFFLVTDAMSGNLRLDTLWREVNPLSSASYVDLDILAGVVSATVFRLIVFSGRSRKQLSEPPSANAAD